MTNANGRLCGCGCGSKVVGRQRFLNDAHRKRAARRRLRVVAAPDANLDNPDANPDDPDDLPGAVEQLIADFPNTSPALAASLRILARELQRSPSRPGLWARFVAVVERVLESVPPDGEAEARSILWEVRTLCDQPETHVGRVVHCGLCCRKT